MPAYRIIAGPSLSADGRTVRFVARIWHDAASRDAGDPPYIEDDFAFSRGAASGDAIDTDPADGWPLLADGSRAPAHDAASVLAEVIEIEPTIKYQWRLGQFAGVVATMAPGNAPLQTAVTNVLDEWDVIRAKIEAKFLGKPYLPDGESWKMVTLPMLTPQAVRTVLLQRYQREVQFKAAAAALVADPDIAAMADEEGEL